MAMTHSLAHAFAGSLKARPGSLCFQHIWWWVHGDGDPTPDRYQLQIHWSLGCHLWAPVTWERFHMVTRHEDGCFRSHSIPHWSCRLQDDQHQLTTQYQVSGELLPRCQCCCRDPRRPSISLLATVVQRLCTVLTVLSLENP